MLGVHSRTNLSGAGANIRHAVYIHQTVGAPASAAQQTAAAMVLEAAAQGRNSGRIQSRCDGVAFVSLNFIAFKLKFDRLIAVD